MIRGDYGKIIIGYRTAVEDNCVIHARPDEKCIIGNNVTIGHGSILHNCKINDWAVIGMGAIVSDYSEIGEWCAIGEGCVVRSKQLIPSKKIAVGIPAKIIGEVTQEYITKWTGFKKIYYELASKRYPQFLKKIK